MIPLCNLHTHTTFCDGKNTPEEMVLEAIRNGACSIGFSAHSPLRVGRTEEEWALKLQREQAYQQEILRLREVYGKQIEILLGIEQEYFSKTPDYPYEYLIGSVHYVEKDGHYIAMDLEPKDLLEAVRSLYGGDSLPLAKDYFALVADVYRKTKCQIVGHFDLLTKFNEKHPCFDTENAEYQAAASDAMDALLGEDVLFEINTGAMSRGWRSAPYPAPFLLKHLAQKKGKAILTGDSHSAEALFFGYRDAVEYAASCGLKELYIYRGGQFEACPLH